MIELILLRHAKAEGAIPGGVDRERTLTDRGRREALAAGRALAAMDASADTVLASPAARTRETAAIVAPAARWPEPAFAEALYDADAETIWQAAKGLGAERVAIVGHNPGLHDLAALLVRQAHDRSRMGQALLDGLPTSGFARFAIGGDVLEAAGPRLIEAWRPER